MTSTVEIDFFWRPGCGFCMLLERRLTKAGYELTKHNIWEHPDNAAFVRSVADGNETVPTVRIGDTAMVNPRFSHVVDAIEAAVGAASDAMTNGESAG